ncbi:hypothetical protein, partial [Nitrosospira multiformis]|uniref:hypothetical protein n=1 Tax=Nitrosospira multiformis TaxID=1231 RepID=UPI001C625EAA
QRRKLTLGMVLETQADHQRRKLTLGMVLETQADQNSISTSSKVSSKTGAIQTLEIDSTIIPAIISTTIIRLNEGVFNLNSVRQTIKSEQQRIN